MGRDGIFDSNGDGVVMVGFVLGLGHDGIFDLYGDGGCYGWVILGSCHDGIFYSNGDGVVMVGLFSACVIMAFLTHIVMVLLWMGCSPLVS